MAKRKKQRSLLRLLLGGLLTLVDLLCEGVARAGVGLLRAILWLARLILIGLWRALRFILHLAIQPLAWLWRCMTGGRLRAQMCLRLTGEEFEDFIALLLRDHHYRRIETTPGSGDQGVDILCERNGKTYAIQCKNYEGAVGNFAVQEAYAGAQFYGCDEAVVVCPGSFTRGAIELAQSTGVTLWDGERLTRMMKKSGRKPHRRKA